LGKKKRNRKKGKLNDQDIMNNFMKGLQTNVEEAKQGDRKGRGGKGD
jgi:hypothetical protein